MTKITDPRIVAAIYQSVADVDKVHAPKPVQAITESGINSKKNVTIIKINKQEIAVPTVGRIAELEKDLQSLNTRLTRMASENRHLKTALRKMSDQIAVLAREMNNKIDKL
jgi:hypothetical protein